MIFKNLLLALLAARSIEAGRDSKRAHFDWDKTDFVYVLVTGLPTQLYYWQAGRLAFGDSYTFVQGTEGNKDFSFLGDNLNLSYTREKLYGDKIVKNQVRTYFTWDFEEF
jgi:hypothetical protein